MKAIADAEAVHVERNRLLRHIKDFSPEEMGLLCFMLTHIDSMTGHIVDPETGKVLTKKEIAELIGVTEEFAGRLLEKLEEMRILSCDLVEGCNVYRFNDYMDGGIVAVGGVDEHAS